MRHWPERILAALCALLLGAPASAFCGFYVAKADTRLFNHASRVVIAHDGDHTVVTMAADYQGTPSDFAMVVPVPTIIRREQVRVVDPALITHVDNYSAPRLVEYHDPDPCEPPIVYPAAPTAAADNEIVVTSVRRITKSLGVKIEASYSVGEYDILILSAKQSDGLVTWLTQNGYRMPPGAAPTVGSYLRQGMKFFVARINLKRRAMSGNESLRPLQIDYVHRKFMLPIRLGTVNASGPQELFVFALTRTGRVETTNYRTVKLPSNMDIPIYVKDQFPAFYRATFTRSVAKEAGNAVFLEYAWDSGSCDPCSADPISPEEAVKLGAGWARPDSDNQSVFVTRLHLRYTRATFPEDLMLQETGDEENFQGRYVLRHKFLGPTPCAEGRKYRDGLVQRWDHEAATLADLTGWRLADIKAKMRAAGDHPSAHASLSWWDSLLASLSDSWTRWMG
jgi:hypothetical protein